MKRSVKSSGSISKERSSGKAKKKTDAAPREKGGGEKNSREISDIGIRMTGRELIPRGEAASHPLFWFMTAFVQLYLLAGGFCAAVVTGLSLSVENRILYPGTLILCIAAALFFFGERLNGYRVYGIMAGILFFALLLFFTQEQFLSGARQMGNAVLKCMNSRYESGLRLLPVGNDSTALVVFLLEIMVPVTFWLAAAVVYRPDVVWTALLLFPAVTVLLLAGGSPSVGSLFLMLFGVLSLLAASRSVRKKKLWGEKGSGVYLGNLTCHKNIQKKTALLICGVGLILSVPGFYIIRPGLSLQLTKAENITAKAEGKLMETMIRVLPNISAGKWNLRVETAGGGVSDGSLSGGEGYVLQGVEDLKITSSSKPEETIYLKGYVGSGYDGDRWLAAGEENFLSAAMNWKTEGDPRLYIQNLPFLRKLYIENEAADGNSQMQELTVERLNANSNYTYYPYNSYLNEYYQVQAGDGYVAGQTLQDDIFSYYPGSDYSEAVESWNLDESKSSVLDRVEASYAAYAAVNYLDVPEGFEELEQQCGEQEIREGDIDGISQYIKSFLSDGYTYSLDAPGLPEGEDFVKYFLYESGTGCSTHYASAATIMFRIFGVPARYVVGYAAPRNLFTAQPDGTYTAVLQDDNSHAWTEIYVAGEGWTPVETTPGALGTAEDVEYRGDEIVDHGTSEEKDEDEQSTGQEQQNEDKRSLKEWMNGSLESVIQGMAGGILLGGLLIGSILLWRESKRKLGLDRRIEPKKRVLDIFRAYYELMVKRGMSPETESFSEEFAVQVRKRNPSLKPEEFSRMMELVLDSCYGFQEQKEEDVRFIRKIYINFWKNRCRRENK